MLCGSPNVTLPEGRSADCVTAELGVGHLLQDGLRVLVEHLAGVGAEHALGGAVQQLRAQLLLQLAQLLGQRRLRDVQHQRGARQRAVIDDGDKVAKLA